MAGLKGLKNAWLSPSGEVITDAPDFFHPSHAWHEGLAGCIVKKLRGFRTTREADEFARKDTPHAYTYEYLESIGWLRLCGWGGLILKWVIPCESRPTPEQKRVIAKWCQANNVIWEKAFDVCGRSCCPIPIMELTDNEKEILNGAEYALRAPEQNTRSCGSEGWFRPKDVGGRNGSYHSPTLGKLCRMGLVERKQHGGYSRGSWRYRITQEGLRVFREMNVANEGSEGKLSDRS